MKYIKFTGKYAELKNKGFVFQKLFAGNYMQWCRDDVRVWKKGGDVTCGDGDLYKIMKLAAQDGNQWSRKGALTIVKVYDKTDHNNSHLVSFTEGRDLVHNWSQSFAEGKTAADRVGVPEAYTSWVSHKVFEAMGLINWEFCEGEDK